MASDVYADDNGNRIVVRHRGPAGRGLIPGGTTGQILVKSSGDDFATTWANSPAGTGAAVGPASAVDENIAVFDGITGKLLKDGGVPISDLATVAALADKEDSVAGKGLSEEDFTTVLKDKLDAAGPEHFLGTFGLVGDLPLVGAEGDYATIEVGGQPALFYFYDVTNSVWTLASAEPPTGEEIAALIFEATAAALWDVDDCFVFTGAYRTMVDNAVSQDYFNAALIAAGVLAPAYGTAHYFSLTGTPVTIVAVSDGTTNMVKADVVTTVGANTSAFDDGGSTARLRYTSTATRICEVEATIAITGTTPELLVFGFAKNGAVIQQSKVLCNMTSDVTTVVISDLISLATNEYIEIFIGNTVNTADPTIHSLQIKITSA